MRKYRLPPIRDEPWDGDEKAKILVMNLYEMEVFTPDFPEQNRKRIYPHKYWTFRIVHFFKVNNKQNEIGQYRWFKGWRFCRFGFCRFCRFCLSC